MSETFFHLLGPGTQPNDDSFSMNPLPITCQVNDEPSMAALEQCAHSPQVIALLNELQHQLSERQPPLGEVLAVDLLNLNADDRHFINTLLGEGEVSVRIQQADDSESEIQEAIFCGLWRVRRRRGEKLLEDKLEAGCAPLALWQAATQRLAILIIPFWMIAVRSTICVSPVSAITSFLKRRSISFIIW